MMSVIEGPMGVSRNTGFSTNPISSLSFASSGWPDAEKMSRMRAGMPFAPCQEWASS